jgi:hypothetical protein
MKIYLFLFLSPLFLVSTGWAQKCARGEEPMVEIDIGESSLAYAATENGSRPTVCRSNLFEIKVNWMDDSVERIRLHGFRPFHPGSKQWFELDNSDAPDLWNQRHLSLIRRCEAPCTTSKKYNLASSWSWGVNDLVNVRSIQMTIDMTLADGRVASFPTAWGERP